VWREAGYEGLLCRCGMVYTNRHGVDILIDPTIEHHEPAFYSLPAELKASWVSANCPSGRLLEVGCGNGFFLKAARRHGYQICGIEPNPRLCNRVSKELGIEIEQRFLGDSQLPRATFDVVYHCDLLVHFPDPISALNTMTAFLRPGGVLCFEVGILGGISTAWYRLIGTIGLGEHLWLYSNRALELLLERSDLMIEETKYFGLVPEVVVGRVTDMFSNRVLKPLLNMAQPLKIFPSPKAALELQSSAHNFFRYRVGGFAPRIGPQTVFVVARPKRYAAAS
jgi:SAM-dependent methyltransferase